MREGKVSRKAVSLIIRNQAFIYIIVGSLLSLIINILLKNFFSNSDYASYVMFLVLFSYSACVSTYCSDQIFLRYYDVENNKITSQLFRNAVISCIIGSCSMIIIAVVIGRGEDLLPYILFCIASPVFIFIPQILRVKSRFNLSVFLSHAWKAVFIITLSLFYVSGYKVSILSIVVFSFFFVYLSFISFCLLANKKSVIRFEVDSLRHDYIDKDGDYVKSQIGFIFSYLSIILITNVDKVILNYYSSDSVLANYAFSFLMLTYPITLISGYFGFKDLVKYKKGNGLDLEKEMLKAALVITSIYLFSSFFLFSIKEKIGLNWDWYLFYVFLLYSILKSTYSQTSSLVIARVKPKLLIKYNFFSILLFIVVCLSYIELCSINSRTIATLFVSLWLIRWGLYYKLAKVIV